MARHNKREFSALCGIETKSLSVYLSRSKVVIDDNGLIDDTNPVNKDFIDRQHNKKGKPNGKSVTPTNGATKEEADEEKQERVTYVKMQRAKAELDLATQENKIVLQKIEIEKKRGELLPTESIKTVITLHSESIKTAYVDASDNLIILFAQKGGLNADDISAMRKKFKDMVNKAISDSIQSSSSMIDQLVKEFSVKKAIGQHD